MRSGGRILAVGWVLQSGTAETHGMKRNIPPEDAFRGGMSPFCHKDKCVFRCGKKLCQARRRFARIIRRVPGDQGNRQTLPCPLWAFYPARIARQELTAPGNTATSARCAVSWCVAGNRNEPFSRTKDSWQREGGQRWDRPHRVDWFISRNRAPAVLVTRLTETSWALSMFIAILFGILGAVLRFIFWSFGTHRKVTYYWVFRRCQSWHGNINGMHIG